jgi:type II secretory pathway pseudopilin PulG
MKKAFSLIELIIIVIVIGILASSINFSLGNSSLNQAADQLINHIRYTQQLAIKDDKYQPYPLDSSSSEGNRSKYWFKQWWQIRFSQNTKQEYWYEVFTDLPYITSTGIDTYLFNKVGNLPTSQWDLSFAREPLDDKYLHGNCDSSTVYPSCEDSNKNLNLTKSYGITKIVYTNFDSSERILFDSYGKPYLKESNSNGDNDDTNPYDNDKRNPLTNIAKITLCSDTNCEQNKSICIYPETGYTKTCD